MREGYIMKEYAGGWKKIDQVMKRRISMCWGEE